MLFGLTADVWRQPTTQLAAVVDPHPADVARLEAALYEFNVDAVGRDDGAGARASGARKIFVSTHSFQAPEFYGGLGYQAAGRWDGYPSGHSQLFLEKSL